MATTLVVLFMMDAVSESIIDLNGYPLGNKEKCDLNITKSILKTVKEKLNLDFGDSLFNNMQNKFAKENFKDTGRNIAQSISDTKTELSDGNMQIKFNITDESECENDFGTTENKSNRRITKEFPKEAPFLVAIFETLSNITAQTCAGTLLSPHWVLTVASCVNVLGYLPNNSINNTNQSEYTIIAESTNPFIDGSAHNVTEVLLHPRNKQGSRAPGRKDESPTLAMMKINPGVPVVGLDVWRNKFTEELKARAYVWIYLKNGPHAYNMQVMSIPTIITGENTRDNTCKLLINEEDLKYNLSLLSSGGPVLVIQGNRARVVAVTRVDGDGAPLQAVPVRKHAAWIENVLRYTDVFRHYLLFYFKFKTWNN